MFDCCSHDGKAFDSVIRSSIRSATDILQSENVLVFMYEIHGGRFDLDDIVGYSRGTQPQSLKVEISFDIGKLRNAEILTVRLRLRASGLL